MTAANNAALARSIYDAFNRGNLDEAQAVATPDAEIVNVGWGVIYRGPDGFREFMDGWKTMDPDCTVEVVRQLAGEDGVVNECVFHGRHVGPLSPPTGEIAPTGMSLSLPFCEVWRIREGKLASLRNYADGVTVMAQLGLLPTPN